MCLKYRLIAVLLLAGALLAPAAVAQHAQEILGPEPGTEPGFVYDPQKEEGPHEDATFEWWYHFGFFKQEGAEDYEYSFISSFQRWNRPGTDGPIRIMFYNLANLKTGERGHYGAMESRPGMTEGMLPEGQKFITDPDPPCGEPESEIWECYGNNSIKKVGDGRYQLSYENDEFTMKVLLENQGPPLPVNGNGLQGMVEKLDQHYYTYPRLSGDVTITRNGVDTAYAGTFWYDHQFGAPKHQKRMRWVFLGLQLDNGENLSLFILRNSRTNEKELWGFTRHFPDGKVEFYKDVTFTPKREWKSPADKLYDVEWTIDVASLGLVLDVEAWGDDHELPGPGGGHLWEGPCKVKVTYKDGSTTTGIGFLEMQAKGKAKS